MNLKKSFMMLVRKLGMMQSFDRLYFQWNKLRFAGRNQKFLERNPDITMPPDYMLYEAFRLDYQSYYNDGMETGRWIVDQFSEFTRVEYKSVLEWGCGPARIIRHLPLILPGSIIHGTDYNAQTIEWCRKNITGVKFSLNQLDPPLAYEDGTFDMVYSISVFTHLSKQNHYSWMEEIFRVLKPEGLFLVSTQGNEFQTKLTTEERELFLSGELVERAMVEEGHRSYSAFQPTAFMKRLFHNKWKILKHIPGTMQQWGPEQDIWIIQKI